MAQRGLDQLLQLVGGEQLRMADVAGIGVAPGELDQPVLQAVEIALEQMVEVPAHRVRVGFEDGIGHRHGAGVGAVRPDPQLDLELGLGHRVDLAGGDCR